MVAVLYILTKSQNLGRSREFPVSHPKKGCKSIWEKKNNTCHSYCAGKHFYMQCVFFNDINLYSVFYTLLRVEVVCILVIMLERLKL